MALTILAVDDSATMRTILEMSFAGEGAKIISVSSADSALARITEVRPDVVILDNSLPGMPSYELCRQLKRSAPQVRALVLASEHYPYDDAKGRQAGVDGSLSKPFETQVLIERVRELTSRKSAEPGIAAGPAVAAPPPAVARPDAAAAARLRQKTVMGTGTAMPAVSAQPPAAFRRAEPTSGLRAPGRAQEGPAASMGRPGERLSLGTAATQQQPVSHPPAASMPGPLPERLSSLGLTHQQVESVMALSREIIEQVVWEVVPELAETLIREELRRLTAK
ncbi:MAG: response regulator [Myxococcales bacterium]|nr:response regulator [Myxococcales bacterium]MCB9709471.1 response regulator [Myxococcales bacterium]